MADFVFVAALRWIDAAAAARLRPGNNDRLISSLAPLLPSPAKIFIATSNRRREVGGRVIPMHTAKPYNFLIARVVVVVPKASESTWAFSDNRAPSGIKHGACLVYARIDRVFLKVDGICCLCPNGAMV